MKTTGLTGSLKALATLAAFVIGSSTYPAWAGENSVYLKTGWFTWDETLNGNSFVKESGVMSGAGMARKDVVSGISIAELLEVWGGNLDYDGHDVTATTDLKSDTSYLGTREEVALAVKLPGSSTLSFEPFAALGHKFWIRTRSGEDWNSFYGRVGMAGALTATGYTLFLKGGVIVPIYTRTHTDLSTSGFTDVVTEPKSRLSAFAEGGVKLGAFAVSVEYEGMEFGQSAKVATSRSTGTSQGVAVQNSQAFQPDSSSTLVSLKMVYSF